MAVLSWGRPDIYVKHLDATSPKWVKIPTPADGTTELSTEKGDKTEAKFEGGELEDVRYAKNTYSLAYQIRVTAKKTLPFSTTDGVVEGNYAVAVVPEDAKTPGIIINKSHVSAEDTYTSADGIAITYTHDALKPDDGGNQVQYGVVTVTESAGAVSDIKIEALSVQDDDSEEKSVDY